MMTKCARTPDSFLTPDSFTNNLTLQEVTFVSDTVSASGHLATQNLNGRPSLPFPPQQCYHGFPERAHLTLAKKGRGSFMTGTRHWCAALVVVLAASAASFGQSAQKAAQDVLKEIGDGNAAALWDALPATYQNDVSFLLHTVATKIDPDVWDKTFELGRKLVEVLETKKQMFLPLWQMSGNRVPGEIEATYDAFFDMLSLLVNSEISKLENVKKLDIGKFVSDTGSKLIKRNMALGEQIGRGLWQPWQAKDIKVTLVGSDQGVATLNIEVPGKPVQTKQFVQVEGKWVPQEMATSWAATMARTKAYVQTMEPDPESIVVPFDRTIVRLDHLAKAENQTQFNMQFVIAQMFLLANYARAMDPGLEPTLAPFDRMLVQLDHLAKTENKEQFRAQSGTAGMSLMAILGSMKRQNMPKKGLIGLLSVMAADDRVD